MSDFDLRPFTSDDARDGQLYTSEGITPDEYENCTLAMLRITAKDYGFGTPYDAEQLREFGAPGTHSGLGWGASVQAAQRAFPELAAVMSVEYPSDVAAAIRDYGAKGYVVHWAAWCDSLAWVPPQGSVVASHALRARWADNGGIGSQNPWPHPDFYLSDDQVRSLWDEDAILVFKRALPGVDDMYDDSDRARDEAILGALLNPPDPGWRHGSNPGDPGSIFYPGAAGSWHWRYARWYVADHPELKLPSEPQNGPWPGHPDFKGHVPSAAYSWEWQFADEAAPDVATKADLSALAAAMQEYGASLAQIAAALKQSTPTPTPTPQTPPPPPAGSADPSWPSLLAELLRRVLGRS